jgi:hypothetical protein
VIPGSAAISKFRMQGTSHRSVELDFFRGLVLLAILVDHIGGSMLSRITLHAFAFNDAAEVFVFLGGFATATAGLSLAARGPGPAARMRFFKRTVVIYRAFVTTAALMLLATFVLRPFFGSAPNLATSDLDSVLATPFAALSDVLLFKRQPYLSSVLPMYAFFALAAPLILPLARSKPSLLLALSMMLWIVAPPVAEYLPSAEDLLWDFNPAAWQLMFVLGVLARCQPLYQQVNAQRLRWVASLVALSIIAGMAYYKLFVLSMPLDGDLKRNLAGLRVVNFVAIAWIAADLARHGVVRQAARWLPMIGAVGRDGLVCFIAGAVISLVVDSALFTATGGLVNVPLGLAADAIALSLLVAVPYRKRLLAVLTPKPGLATPGGEGRGT